MARIRKRGKSWHVELRRVDIPPAYASFETLREARRWADAEESAALLRRSREARKYSVVAEAAMRASRADILEAASLFHNGCGVYVLLDGASIVYIGRSRNVLSRLLTHRKNGRNFTHYLTIPCAPEQAEALERELIGRFLPDQNQMLVPHSRPNGPENRAST